MARRKRKKAAWWQKPKPAEPLLPKVIAAGLAADKTAEMMAAMGSRGKAGSEAQATTYAVDAAFLDVHNKAAAEKAAQPNPEASVEKQRTDGMNGRQPSNVNPSPARTTAPGEVSRDLGTVEGARPVLAPDVPPLEANPRKGRKQKQLARAQAFKLHSWLGCQQETILSERWPYRVAAIKATEALGFEVTPGHVRNVVRDAEMKWPEPLPRDPRKTMTQSNKTRKRLRILWRLVRHLYERLGETIPQSFIDEFDSATI